MLKQCSGHLFKLLQVRHCPESNAWCIIIIVLEWERNCQMCKRDGDCTHESETVTYVVF